jgi:cytochrome c553
MPEIVKHGSGKLLPACAMCHLASGLGHPESANLTGLSVSYLVRQLAEFKSGAGKDYSRMASIAQGLSDDDAQQASESFATLKPEVWTRAVEAAKVPKTFVNDGRMRFPQPSGGAEPLGNRIIILPEGVSRTLSRDPHSGFVA